MAAAVIGGVNVSFSEAGSGPGVVLLHCSASTGEQWRGLREALQQRFRVLAPDLVGYGGTDPWCGRGPLILADEAALAAGLLPQGEPFHLVGHSYGGAVALRLAYERPERVRSLTLIEPVAFHLLRERDPQLFDEVRRVAASVSDAVLTGAYERGMADFVDYWNGPGTWARIPAEVRRRLAPAAAKVALDFHAAMTEQTPLEAYARFDFPVLILCGERSPATTRRIATLLGEGIAAARLRVVPGAGHMLPLTHADLVNAAVAAHFERSRQPSAAAA